MTISLPPKWPLYDQNDPYEAKWALFEIHTQKTVIQRVEKLSVILAEYDTKMTDIWKTHQSDRC